MKKPHLLREFDEDLSHLRAQVEAMAARAQGMLAESIQALRQRDSARAKQVVAADRELNGLEVEIDEHCLKLLARWQPTASDLRFVAAVLKLVTDLERIGDHCVNICERVLELDHGEPPSPIDLDALATAVQAMLHDALAALHAEDVQLAGQVIERGQQSDALSREIIHSCFASLARPAGDPHIIMHWHQIGSYLQRIAAHATNIAEMVVFLVRGEDVRHPGKLPARPGDDRSPDRRRATD